MVRVVQLVSTFHQAMVTWMGPFLPLLTLFHPDYIRPIATASGTVAAGLARSGAGVRPEKPLWQAPQAGRPWATARASGSQLCSWSCEASLHTSQLPSRAS